MKFLIIFVLALLLLQACAEASSFSTAANSLDNAYEENEAVNPHKYIHSHTIHCGKECGRRCKKALKEKRCKRACLACCHKCKCVPPGTYGNKELCPCYARLKTHGNKPKCP